MTPKKVPKADLENKRVLFLEIGLATAVVLAILVFSSGSRALPPMPAVEPLPEPYISVMTPVTIQEQKRPATALPLKTKVLGAVTIVPNDTRMIEVPNNIFNEFPTGDIFGEGKPGGTDGYYGGIELADDPVFFVEDMPKFQNGDLVKFRNWVSGRIVYPQMAREMRVTGKVVLSFVIERDGRLSEIEVLSSPDRLLADEAVRILRQSPVWTPGFQNDIPARVKFTLPIDFVLQ